MNECLPLMSGGDSSDLSCGTRAVLTNQLCLWLPGQDSQPGLHRGTLCGLEGCRLQTVQQSDNEQGSRGEPLRSAPGWAARARRSSGRPRASGEAGRPEARARGPGGSAWATASSAAAAAAARAAAQPRSRPPLPALALPGWAHSAAAAPSSPARARAGAGAWPRQRGAPSASIGLLSGAARPPARRAHRALGARLGRRRPRRLRRQRCGGG